jgi:hypothetical protein
VCNGVDDECPQDIILDDTLCLVAGQSTYVGAVSLKAAPSPIVSNSFDFCVTITLDGATLTGSEPIKAEFSTTETPGSAPGKYSYKFPSGGIVQTHTAGVYKLAECKRVTMNDLCGEKNFQLYFAIHLDVSVGGSSETAWALECPADPALPATELGPGLPFINKKGTAKAQVLHLEALLPNGYYSTCDQCAVVPTPTPSPVPS